MVASENTHILVPRQLEMNILKWTTCTTCLSCKCIIRFIFQEGLDDVVKLWNSHRIRPSKHTTAPHGRPMIMYFMPHLYNITADQLQVLHGSNLRIIHKFNQKISNSLPELYFVSNIHVTSSCKMLYIFLIPSIYHFHDMSFYTIFPICTSWVE